MSLFPARHRGGRAALTALLAAGVLAAVPAAGQAATSTFGSSLLAPATLDTAKNLNYSGHDIKTINGTTPVTVHVYHDGADTALWNSAPAPAAGQILSVKLEGCAQPASGGPSPLTQFHFQSLTPQGGGAVTVGVTTQAFDLPVCGVNGAGGSTVTTYAPTNFCVKQGDFVDFNDEGGFDSTYYPNGVPYQVIASAAGSALQSFIGDNQTNNGSTLSPSRTGATNGFASNPNEELLMQAVLGTGSDATPLCPGGTAGQRAATAPSGPVDSIPSASKLGLKVRPQTDGINHSGMVKLAVYCAQTSPCAGTVALMAGATKLASGALRVPGRKTSHVALRLSSRGVKLIRKRHRRLRATMIVRLVSGQSFSGPVGLKL